jgi:lipopolysaccharide export LptBFGC system permease protein LptF
MGMTAQSGSDLKNATAISNFEVSDEVTLLKKLRNNYIEWAKSKGLTSTNRFNIIMKTDKNELINQYDSNFYKELKTAVAKKDFRWILDNVDKVEVIKKIKALRKKYLDLTISVDGGVNFDNYKKLVKAGANKLISGSAIYESENIKEAVEEMKNNK